jgi:predicted nicotinamide N-methyase
MATREIELENAPGGRRTLEIAEASDLENDAGASLWDCALVLAHYLDHQARPGCKEEPLAAGKSVLELGAGADGAAAAAPPPPPPLPRATAASS